jgi:hypothetical protein
MKRTVIDLDVTVGAWHEEGANLDDITDLIQRAVDEKLDDTVQLTGRVGPLFESRFINAHASLPSDDRIIETDVPDGFAEKVRERSFSKENDQYGATELVLKGKAKEHGRPGNPDWCVEELYQLPTGDVLSITQDGLGGTEYELIELDDVSASLPDNPS